MLKFTQRLNNIINSTLINDKKSPLHHNHNNKVFFRNSNSKPIQKIQNNNYFLHENIIYTGSKTVINSYNECIPQKNIHSNIENKNLNKVISAYTKSSSSNKNKNFDYIFSKIDTPNYMNSPKIHSPSYQHNNKRIPSFKPNISYSAINLKKILENNEINRSLLNTSTSSKSVRKIKNRKINNRVENKIIKQIELIKGENKENKIKNILINKPPRTLNTDICKFNSKEYCSLLPSNRIIKSQRSNKFEYKNNNNIFKRNIDDDKLFNVHNRSNKSNNIVKKMNFYYPNNYMKMNTKVKLNNEFNYNNNYDKSESIFDKLNKEYTYDKSSIFKYEEGRHTSSNSIFY